MAKRGNALAALRKVLSYMRNRKAAAAAVALLVVGLALTAIGALVAAKAVIISSNKAQILSGTDWGHNQALRNSLIEQSRSARFGLLLVFAGTIFQVVGTLLSLFGQDGRDARHLEKSSAPR
jgi:hypothetical protein